MTEIYTEVVDKDLDAKTYIGEYCVSTVKLSTPHTDIFEDLPDWYETMIFPVVNNIIKEFVEVYSCRYKTLKEAEVGHVETCSRLDSGTLNLRI